MSCVRCRIAALYKNNAASPGNAAQTVFQTPISPYSAAQTRLVVYQSALIV